VDPQEGPESGVGRQLTFALPMPIGSGVQPHFKTPLLLEQPCLPASAGGTLAVAFLETDFSSFSGTLPHTLPHQENTGRAVTIHFFSALFLHHVCSRIPLNLLRNVFIKLLRLLSQSRSRFFSCPYFVFLTGVLMK